MFLEVLLHLQQEFNPCHEKLSHLHPKFMFSLVELGILSKYFLDLKDDVPLCVSCLFVLKRRSQCRTKLNKSGTIQKYTGNKPGAEVSVDNISHLSHD